MTTEPNVAASTPRWVGVMIAVLLLGAMCAAAGWGLWSYLHQPKQSELVEVRGDDFTPRRRFVQPQRVVASDVRQLPNGGFRVSAGEVILNATRQPNSQQWTLQLTYIKSDLVPAEQTAALVARFRLTNDPAFARSLKVTDEQIKQLKEVPAGTGMVVSDADRAKVRSAWDRYAAAMQSDNLKALQQAMTEVGQTSLESTRAAIAQRAQKVQSILAPEQIAPFKQ